MKYQIQELMDKVVKATRKVAELEAVRDGATAMMRITIENLERDIAEEEKKHRKGIDTANAALTDLRSQLGDAAIAAYNAGDVFPEDKKRLTLSGKAWVQVTQPKDDISVEDPSAFVRWAIDKNVEDSVIKGITIEREAVEGAVTLGLKPQGLQVQKKPMTASISLPKEETDAT